MTLSEILIPALFFLLVAVVATAALRGERDE